MIVKHIIGLFEVKPVPEERKADPPKYLVDMYWVNLYVDSVSAIYKEELDMGKVLKPKAALELLQNSSHQVGDYCITHVVRTLASPHSQNTPCPALQCGKLVWPRLPCTVGEIATTSPSRRRR